MKIQDGNKQTTDVEVLGGYDNPTVQLLILVVVTVLIGGLLLFISGHWFIGLALIAYAVYMFTQGDTDLSPVKAKDGSTTPIVAVLTRRGKPINMKHDGKLIPTIVQGRTFLLPMFPFWVSGLTIEYKTFPVTFDMTIQARGYKKSDATGAFELDENGQKKREQTIPMKGSVELMVILDPHDAWDFISSGGIDGFKKILELTVKAGAQEVANENDPLTIMSNQTIIADGVKQYLREKMATRTVGVIVTNVTANFPMSDDVQKAMSARMVNKYNKSAEEMAMSTIQSVANGLLKGITENLLQRGLGEKPPTLEECLTKAMSLHRMVADDSTEQVIRFESDGKVPMKPVDVFAEIQVGDKKNKGKT